ncbi:hypothetical protein TNCV_4739021 [Trichonephila clavipes]|nr:hypothetical protein TNCV_4739021 [Trichonephila clavipes]
MSQDSDCVGGSRIILMNPIKFPVHLTLWILTRSYTFGFSQKDNSDHHDPKIWVDMVIFDEIRDHHVGISRICVTAAWTFSTTRLPSHLPKTCGFYAKLRKSSFPLKVRGHGSLVVKLTDSWLVYPEFEPVTAEDPTCRGGRCTLNMPRLKQTPVGVASKLGQRRVPAQVSTT